MWKEEREKKWKIELFQQNVEICFSIWFVIYCYFAICLILLFCSIPNIRNIVWFHVVFLFDSICLQKLMQFNFFSIFCILKFVFPLVIDFCAFFSNGNLYVNFIRWHKKSFDLLLLKSKLEVVIHEWLVKDSYTWCISINAGI